ncbi:MAG: adenylate/guanylate cyclase domain-containing protein [Spirochaetales bacterium]|nr:adenylate/guanylate cyclase domain-containing protein [Spirochaetales bacterium]
MASNSLLIQKLKSPTFFGLLLGVLVFGAFLAVGTFTDVLDNMEVQVMDLHFNLKESLVRERSQENVVQETRSRRISDDILLIGIENSTLDTLGRWPFPRSYHADLLNSFTRVKNGNDRESAILLDILFNDVADRAFEDVVLLDAIRENGRVALQSLLQGKTLPSAREEEFGKRIQTLIDNYGEITNVSGDIAPNNAYYSVESPLIPYGNAVAAYGHATYQEDPDKVFRRQQLISRYSEKINEFPIEQIQAGMDFGTGPRGHLAWLSKEGEYQTVELPLKDDALVEMQRNIARNGLPRFEEDENGREKATYYVGVFKDHHIPAITLTLSLMYFNKTIEDVEVVYGSHILIPSPERWDPRKGEWIPYEVPIDASGRRGLRAVDEIRIPIDREANMLINFMGRQSSAERGGRQTFPVRPYAAYATSVRGSDPSTWPETKRLGGKILMVGAFSLGMADDEKTTPMGLMFGVEMHANALNTIIMDNFIKEPPSWMNSLILFLLVISFALLTSRMKNLGWSAAILLAFVLASFLGVTMAFEFQNLLLDWASPIVAVLITYITVVIYRVLTAERDKRQIKGVFGQFISPAVVDELSNHPPELGGEDVDVTVFFSDIRGFSRISERLSAQELVTLLNEYLTDMTNNLVNDYSGTLDKYIGDAIMAFWGAPRPQKDHAVRACKCAVMQIRLLNALNERLAAESDDTFQPLNIGIGLNSGECMVGYMGSEGRKNYTAMGDTVNLASRLEGVNKTYQTNIIISEDTREKIKEEPFVLRELDQIRVKGRFRPVTIYELVDYDGDLEAELDLQDHSKT